MVTRGAEGGLGVLCGAEGGQDHCLVMLTAQVSAPKAGSLFFTPKGKAAVPPVGCAFKLALLPATVQRSKKEQRLFPRSQKTPITLTLWEMPGKGSEFSDHFV